MPREQAADSVIIGKPRDEIIEALLDIESQPVWARAVKSVAVKERDAAGRASLVRLEYGALGRRVHFTLRYDYGRLPSSYGWALVEGDARQLEGEYRFEPLSDGNGANGRATKVTYATMVRLSFPLPDFVLRRAERLLLTTALRELKAYVEG